MSAPSGPPADVVDRIVAAWREARPDLDPSPIGVVGRVSRTAVRLQRRLDEVFAQHGLQPGGFDVLATLRRSGPPYRMSPSQLHRSLMIASGSMTARLDRLEQAGLVAREPDPNDRRALLVGLTPAGFEVIDRAVVDHLANEQRLLAVLDEEERETLAALLRKLLLHLGDEAEHLEK
jgi:DNA-binding MarR family transcriptional regulator